MSPLHISAVHRVLLVEDDPDDAFLVSRMLRADDLRDLDITHVTTLEDTLAVLATATFDAVLLDLWLPDSQDSAVVATIRRAAPELPIVVLTGTDDVTLAVDCIQQGAQDYIPKQDLDTRSLRRALSYAIARVQIEQRDEELRRRNLELERRDRMMRGLAARQIAIRELERTRIAREVHDQLGQLLTGLKMDLRWMGRRLADDEPSLSEVSARLAEADALVDRTIETVQRIAIELRPTVLDKLGLASAMRDEVRRFAARCPVDAEVEIAETPRPAPEQATALFRILQELLANVARHADAGWIHVGLEAHDGVFELRVEDDGCGLAEGVEFLESSLGLMSVRERAESLGGEARFETGESGGTRALVRVPRDEG